MEQDYRRKIFQAVEDYYDYISLKKSDKSYIPTSGKLLDKNDLLNLVDASLDMWLTCGRYNDEFEKSLSEFLNVKHVLTVNSGSSANLLAISALTSYKLKEKRLKKGDEVITTATSFPTTVNPIIQNGLVPVFVDCELATYNIDVEKIEEAITDKTKLIIITHTLGNCYKVDKVAEICEKHNLWLIEDTCDALGGEYNSKKLGTIGHIGTFSFYPAHHITMGEGGAVSTNDTTIFNILKSFRDWGRDCSCPTGKDNVCNMRFSRQFGKLPFGYDHKYTYSHLGFNMKITDMQAAIGCSQLKKLPDFLKKRTKNAEYLRDKLADLSEYLILPKTDKNSTPSWFGFLISVKKTAPFTKQKLVEFLEKNDIGTRQLFAGNILRQPMFVENEIDLKIGKLEILNSKMLNDSDYSKLPNTEFVMNNTFWVGIFPTLGEKELDRTSNVIHKFIRENV